MSAELARRLVHSGAAPAQVEALLFEAHTRGISFCQALNELRPEFLDMLERALDRGEYPSIHSVRPMPQLVRALPPGMCERLMALPIHLDTRAGRVDVAAVDVLDPHIASEFAFHLALPIRVMRASFSEVVTALQSLRSAGIFMPGLSKIIAAGPSVAPVRIEPGEPRAQSEPPLLLLKKAPAPDRAWIPDVPAVSYSAADSFPPEDASGEPVLSLRRSKPFSVPVSEGGPPWTVEFDTAMLAFEQAESADQVVSSLCDGLRPVRALVFALRNKEFELRGGSATLGTPAELRGIRIPAGTASMLDLAAHSGFYLGPFAQLSTLTSLDTKWAVRAGSDCYARTVMVSGRPSLIVLMVGFSESTEASRRADALARVAGNALERILRFRKKV